MGDEIRKDHPDYKDHDAMYTQALTSEIASSGCIHGDSCARCGDLLGVASLKRESALELKVPNEFLPLVRNGHTFRRAGSDSKRLTGTKISMEI